MARLSLALLGAPEARHGGRLVVFRTRKALALLIYLAAAGGAPTRDRLTALFWPDSDEPHGRMMLRRTLAFLRQNLGEAGQPVPHLVVGRDSLSIDFTADFELDLEQVEQAAAGRPGAAARGGPTDVAGLQAAAALVRGDFLEGFSLGDAPEFDDWAAAQRAYWHQRASVVFDRLSAALGQAGDRPGALASLTRWLMLDPLDETAYQRLMQVHLAAGDRAAALEVFGTAQAALARELGVEPAPATLVLAERARLAAGPPPLVRPLSAAQPPTLAEGPLVGRGDEFSQLISAYHAARQGQTQCVIVEGEAGIGKTRLASDFLAWAEAQGAQVSRGRAFEAGGRLPYQPVVEALRAGLAQDAQRVLDELGDVWLGELAQLLPELSEHAPRARGPAANEAAAQSRLFESVARLGAARAARAPVILFIDDLQWADVGSLDLLHYAARRWAGQGAALLLLGTLRSELLAAPPGPAPVPLADWLAGLTRDLGALRLRLGPLKLDDTRSYLERLSAAPRAAHGLDAFAGWLFAETSGQPFFIVETLKALLQQEVLRLQPSPGGHWLLDVGGADVAGLDNLIPPGVRELIRGRLARLGPGAASLLAAGAVLGRDVTFDELCGVSGLSEDAGLAAWDDLLASGLLVPAAGAAGRCRFAHDKIRDVTYTEAGEARRRVFHRRALAALEAAGAPSAELAQHALAAGQPEAAFRHSLAAGDEAMRLYAVRDALQYYERALRAAESLPAAHGLGQLYHQLGRAREAASDYAGARAAYEQALARARAASDPRLECVVLNRLANLAGIHNFQSDEVSKFLGQAVQVAGASGDTLGLAETEWTLAHYAFYGGQLAPAREHGRRALALAEQLSADELIARSLNVLGYVELGANDWAAAEAYAERARPLFAALGDRAALADCLLQVANARLNTGRLSAGIEAAREARRISQEIEHIWSLVLGAVHLAHGLCEAGQYQEALAVAEEGAHLGRRLGMNALSIFMLNELGAVRRALFDLDGARAVHLEAQALNEGFPTRPFLEPVAAELCADEALAGRWSEAARLAREALAGRDRVQAPFFGLTRWLETEALVRSGAAAAARADMERFEASSRGNPRFRIPVARALAVLAAADGQSDLALDYLREAVALSQQLGLPGQAWPALAALAELHRSRGETELAQAASARAAEIGRSLAAGLSDEQQRVVFLSGIG